MAGSKLNTYAVGDVNLTNMMEVLDACRQGYHKVSLTNMDTTDEPEIAEGSKIEINGALFVFNSDESILGSPSDGDVYVKLTPSGDSVTASFTNTAPTWDSEKGGWYEPATNNRYLNFVMWLESSAYINKHEYPNFCVFGASAAEISSSYLADPTGIGTELATESADYGQDNTQEFELLKPISGYVYATDSYGVPTYVRKQVQLNPGTYRLRVVANGTATLGVKYNNAWETVLDASISVNALPCILTLYLMGIYGINNVDDLSKIRTLL